MLRHSELVVGQAAGDGLAGVGDRMVSCKRHIDSLRCVAFTVTHGVHVWVEVNLSPSLLPALRTAETTARHHKGTSAADFSGIRWKLLDRKGDPATTKTAKLVEPFSCLDTSRFEV